MSDYIHISAMKPIAIDEYGLGKSVPVGRTMCEIEYQEGDPWVVPHDLKDAVTCSKCKEGIDNSAFAHFSSE